MGMAYLFQRFEVFEVLGVQPTAAIEKPSASDAGAVQKMRMESSGAEMQIACLSVHCILILTRRNPTFSR
jgi:hypothetical protein